MKQLILLTALVFGSLTAYSQNDSVRVQLDDGTMSTLESQLSRDSEEPSALKATREYSAQQLERKKFDEDRWREVVGGRNYADTRTRKRSHQQGESRSQSEGASGPRVRDEAEDDPARYDYDDEASSVNVGWLGPVAQLIFYGIIIAIIALIIVQVLRNVSLKANPKKPATPSSGADEIHDITTLDTDDLILKAHNARDYKLAIRLYFLDLLKKLNENGMIEWTKDKTNRDYLSELFSKQYYFNEVRRLTLAYERVWYGEHVPTEEGYHELRSEFRTIQQKFQAP